MAEKENNKKAGVKPNYTSDGVAVWVNISKETNKPYLSIKITGHNTIYAYDNTKKEDQK